MPDDPNESLEDRLVRWLDQEGLTHRRSEASGTRFNLEVRSQTGLLYNVGQRSAPSDAIVVSGSILLPDSLRRLLEKSTRRRRESFLQDLRFELLLAGHSFQFLPAEGTPNQIAVAAQIWEDGLTKDAFMRVMQQVVNGLILIVWSAEEGAGYLSQSRKARRPRTKE